MAIWLGQQKFPRSIRGPVVNNKKPCHPYAAMMIKVLWQAQHFVAHGHERSYFILIIADGSVIKTQQRMHSHAFF